MEKLKNIFPVAKFKSLIGIAVGVIVIIPMTTLPTYQLQEVLDAPLKSEEMNVAQSQGQEIGNEEFANQDVAQEVEEEIESIQVIYKEKPFTGKVEVGDILIFGKYGYNNAFEVKDLQWRVLDKTDTKCLITTTYGGNDTIDKVFLLSVEDVLKYMPEDRLRRIMDTEGISTNPFGYRAWMLRTPVFSMNEYEQLIAAVGMNGQMVAGGEEYFSVDSELGVRPAMWIDINKASGLASIMEEKDIFADIKVVELLEAEKFMQGQDNTYQIGKSLVEYGVYEQDNNIENGKEPIQWIVYDINEETNALKLLSRYILDTRQFNDDVNKSSWEKSSLREWLNNEFYTEAFSEQEKNGLLDNTIDNVCLFDMGIEGDLETAKGTPYAIANGLDYDENYGGNSPWWRRVQENDSLWSVVTASGTSRYALSKTEGIGVRPVIWVDLDDVILKDR